MSKEAPLNTPYPYPVLTVGNDPEGFFRELRVHGIHRWEQLTEPLLVPEYREQRSPLTPAQERATTMFVPRIEVIDFREPGANEAFTGVRLNTKPWASCFTLLPQDPHELDGYDTHREWVDQLTPDEIGEALIPLTFEFKHGVGDLYPGAEHDACTIVTPSGVPNKDEWPRGFDSLEDCARREFRNEFGLDLENVTPLGPRVYGFSVSPRRSNETVQPFWVEPKLPLEFHPRKSGKSEQLLPFLITVNDYRELVRRKLLIEIYSAGIVYIALEHLGRLQIV